MAIYEFPKSEPNFIESYTLDLLADRVKVLESYGRTFACVKAEGGFKMSFNNGKYFDSRRGVEWTLQENERYNLLKFISDADQTIEILTGNFFYHENVVIPVIQVAKTRAIPGPITIGAAASVDLETVPAGMAYRKSVIITNKDPAVDLDVKVKDAAGVYQPGSTVFHLQEWQIETSDAVRITNPGGAPVSVGIIELFYLTQ